MFTRSCLSDLVTGVLWQTHKFRERCTLQSATRTGQQHLFWSCIWIMHLFGHATEVPVQKISDGGPCLIRRVRRGDAGTRKVCVGRRPGQPGRRHPCRVRAERPLLLLSRLQRRARAGGELPLSTCTAWLA